MLNEERIRMMTKLARYEAKDGKKALKISRYYRHDYLGLALLKNFFLVTIGYLLVLVMIAGYFLDFLLDHVQELNIRLLITGVVAGYAAVLVLYTVITYVVSSVRYARARKSVKGYYGKLGELSRLYARKEKKLGRRLGRRNDDDIFAGR